MCNVDSGMRLVFSWDSQKSNFYADPLRNREGKITPLDAGIVRDITLLAITIIGIVAVVITMIVMNPIVGCAFALPFLLGSGAFIGVFSSEYQKRKELLAGNVDPQKDYNDHIVLARKALSGKSKNSIEEIKKKYNDITGESTDEAKSLLISALAIRILENKSNYNEVRGRSNFSCVRFVRKESEDYLEVAPLKNDGTNPFRILLDHAGIENIFGNETLNLKKEIN